MKKLTKRQLRLKKKMLPLENVVGKLGKGKRIIWKQKS